MAEKPNVLMINVDHWPGALLHCAGQKDILTPTLDQLAENGVRFSNFYSECPVCIPARRSLMTGLSPRSHGDRTYSAKMEFPDNTSLAQAFVNAGYQAYGVGKLHVFPQRNRIGFNDVILAEEARYEFGEVDDYQRWLGEQGFVGQEYMHGMGNNAYHTRPWHLPERAHATNWATMEMVKTIKRKDPTKPAFYYISYQHPHPPLVPLQQYLDMYDADEIDDPICGDWVDDSYIMQAMCAAAFLHSAKEIKMAKRAFYALCTHIDHQIRILLGTLREMNLLANTLIVFTSDHGDMLFDHNMVAKRSFYEGSANIPFIISGQPIQKYCGNVDTQLGSLADVMPTILDICGIELPKGMDGIALLNEATKPHDIIYGEIGEGAQATRMVTDGQYKLIYYPCGNVFQMFDLQNDPKEMKNIADCGEMSVIRDALERKMIAHMYGVDAEWIKDGKLVGFDAPGYQKKADYLFYNQRGYHWPPPSGYKSKGKS